MKSKINTQKLQGRFMKMEKLQTTLMVVLAVAFLTLGAVGHGLFAEPNTVVKEVPVVKETIVEKLVNQTVEVEVPVADASSFREDAIQAIFDEYGDDDDFLTCDGHEYEEDEVKVSSKQPEWSYTYLDSDESEVSGELKLVYSDGSDERDCKRNLEFKVLFEDGEEPEVSI